jgi:hypothetical protein
MRGTFVDQGGLFSYIAPEARVPVNHPLRKIRECETADDEQGEETLAGRTRHANGCEAQ